MRALLVMGTCAVVVGAGGGDARAEQGEKAIGIEGALLLPGFASDDSTAFALATWGLGGSAQYGLFDDLSAELHVSFASFGAAMASTQMYKNRPLSGQLYFAATQVHVEAGGRYKLYAGENLAPYVELMGGMLWTSYRSQDLRNDAGQSYGLPISDRGEGSVTLSVGLAADYRVFNMVFVGVALRYVQPFGGTCSRFVSAPLQVSYFW